MSDIEGGLVDEAELLKVKNIYERFAERVDNPPGKPPGSGSSIEDLQALKRRIMRKVSDDYGKDTMDKVETETRKKIASALKDFVNDRAVAELGEYTGGKVARLNNQIHNASSVEDSLVKSVGEMRAGQAGGKQYQIGGSTPFLMQRAAEVMSGGEAGLGLRGSIREVMEKSTMLMMLNKPIPRTSRSILDSKNIIFAKLSANFPVIADLFSKLVLEQDNKTALTGIKNNYRTIASALDQIGVLEESKYGEIDGKPSVEGARLYLKDIENDKKLSAFEKAEEADRFNREGTLKPKEIKEIESKIKEALGA